MVDKKAIIRYKEDEGNFHDSCLVNARNSMEVPSFYQLKEGRL